MNIANTPLWSEGHTPKGSTILSFVFSTTLWFLTIEPRGPTINTLFSFTFQSYEKIRILKEEFEKKGNKSAINKIDKILKTFDEFSLKEIPAAIVVTKAKEAINKY